MKMIGLSQRHLKTFEDSTRLTFVLLILFYNSMPGISIGDTLILSPEGTTQHYVGSDITYHCSHTNHSARQFGWLINSNPYESSNLSYFSSVIDRTPNFTILNIHDIFAKYNNTEIQCFAITESEEYLNRSSIIILQGIPHSVRNFSVIVNEDSLDFSWMTPPYLIIDDVVYIFEIVNLTTLNITTHTLFKRKFSIPYTPHQSNKCLNFSVNISAKNEVGIGENISLFRMDSVPDKVDHYLIKNDNKFDLYVLMSNPVCTISNIVVKNKDLNNVHLESNDFEGFSFDKATSEIYWYKLNLNLKNRYTYGINFIPENIMGGDKYVSINSSTHDIRNIKVMETSENEIIIKVNNFNYRNYFVGAFVALLYCGITSCTDIDYNNSMYFLTYDVKMNTFNMNHSRGYYLVNAYDIRNDGSVISSEDDDKIAFSIQSDQIYLNSTGHSIRFEPYQKSICSLKQDNFTVSSQCIEKKKYSMNVKQQLILQQLKYNGFITISDPTLLTELICLEISNGTYNAGITILLTLKPEERSNVPLGIRLIQDNDNNNEPLLCDALPTSPLPTNGTVQPNEPLSTGELLQKILIAISAAEGVILIILLIAIFIIVAAIICYCKKKAAKYKLDESRTDRAESELHDIKRLNITDLDSIYQEVNEKWKQWYNHGLNLGISEDELKKIKENNHGNCLKEMLEVWLTKYPATQDMFNHERDNDHADP